LGERAGNTNGRELGCLHACSNSGANSPSLHRADRERHFLLQAVEELCSRRRRGTPVNVQDFLSTFSCAKIARAKELIGAFLEWLGSMQPRVSGEDHPANPIFVPSGYVGVGSEDACRRARGIYVNTVNCLPVCRAARRRSGAGQIQTIATDLFPEMLPYFKRGTISASIYQDPYLQGQTAVRLLVDFLSNGRAIPPACYLNPAIALHSNLHLFREVGTAQVGTATPAKARS
jgi:hypothetical protein